MPGRASYIVQLPVITPRRTWRRMKDFLEERAPSCRFQYMGSRTTYAIEPYWSPISS